MIFHPDVLTVADKFGFMEKMFFRCLFIDKNIYNVLRCICSRYKFDVQRGDCDDIFSKGNHKAEKERQDI